jgi:transposase
LPTAYVPPNEIRDLRELVRLHVYLVHERTGFKNKVRAELAKRWFRLTMNPFTKRGRENLAELDSRTVHICTDVIETLDKNIKELERELKSKAGESKEARLLMSIPRVGYFSAVSILAEIGDISRFESDEKLCSYAGLVPSTKESGYMSIHGRITKQESPFLRWILEECVWAHLRCAKDTSLTRFFYRMLWKGKKAAVATARKLLRVVWAL